MRPSAPAHEHARAGSQEAELLQHDLEPLAVRRREIRVSGSRSSSWISPRIASAAFTGIGFVSQKSASKSGSSR